MLQGNIKVFILLSCVPIFVLEANSFFCENYSISCPSPRLLNWLQKYSDMPYAKYLHLLYSLCKIKSLTVKVLRDLCSASENHLAFIHMKFDSVCHENHSVLIWSSTTHLSLVDRQASVSIFI